MKYPLSILNTIKNKKAVFSSGPVRQLASCFAQIQTDSVKDLGITNVSVISMVTNDVRENRDVVIKDVFPFSGDT